MIFMSICDCFACHLNYVFLYVFMLSGSCKYLCIYSVRSLNWKKENCLLCICMQYHHKSMNQVLRIQTLLFYHLTISNAELNEYKQVLKIVDRPKVKIMVVLGYIWNARIDLMHWRHVSITTTPCWGQDLALSVSARARAGPAVWNAGVGLLAACLAMAHMTVPRLTPNMWGRPFYQARVILIVDFNQL